MNVWMYTILFMVAPLFVLLLLADDIDDDDDSGPGRMIPAYVPTN